MILVRALAWVQANEKHFLTEIGTDGIRFIIRLAELAMAGEILSRRADRDEQPPLAGIGGRWLSRAWNALDGGARITDAIKANPDRAILAASYVPFVRANLLNPEIERALQSALPECKANPIDRFHIHAALARLSMASWRIANNSFNHLNIDLRHTPRRVPAYTISHAVFAFTDLAHRPGGGPRKLRRVVLERLSRWQRSALRSRDWDLLAEWIMTGHSIGAPCAPPHIWKALAKAQRPDGAIAPKRASFARAYHPTLATLMAAGLCSVRCGRGSRFQQC